MSAPYATPIRLSTEDIAQQLARSVIEAVESGLPDTLIDCPGFTKANQRMRLAAYMEDAFSAPGEEAIYGMLKLWAMALKSTDVALRLEAMAQLSAMTQKHVAFHLDDALRRIDLEDGE